MPFGPARKIAARVAPNTNHTMTVPLNLIAAPRGKGGRRDVTRTAMQYRIPLCTMEAAARQGQPIDFGRKTIH